MRKTILITFALLCAVVQGAWAQTPSGNWTDNGNYSESWTTSTDGKTVYINSAADLARMAFCINNDTGLENFGSGYTFLLTQDLDMSAHNWIPIGLSNDTQDYRFKGVFDGQGHTISGIQVNRTNMSCGLFGEAYQPAVIKNLKIANSTITGGEYAGGVVGYAYLVDITDIICDATVSGLVDVGGIVGYNRGSTIKRCIYTGSSITVTGTQQTITNSGPLVGSDDKGEYENNFYTSPNFSNAVGASRGYTMTVSGLSDVVKIDWVDTPHILIDNTLYLPDGAAMRMGLYCTSTDGNSMPTKRITGLSIGNTAVNISPDCLYRHTFSAATEEGQTIAVSSAAFDFSGQDGSESKPYLISQSYQWDAFANAVTNAGITFEGKYFKLNNNVTVGTMVGINGRPFKGTFKGSSNIGDYYILTFNCGTAETPYADEYCAPFRYISGATIERLKVAGTIYTSNKHAGGIVAMVSRASSEDSYATSSISTCRSSVIINSTVSGIGYHGGFVACVNEGYLNITGCRFDGKMLGSSTTGCGGFIGHRAQATNVAITNCLFSPSEATVGGWAFIYYVTDRATITNCFYTANLGVSQGSSCRTSCKPANIGTQSVNYSDITGLTVFEGGLGVDRVNGNPQYYYVSSVGLNDNGEMNADMLSDLNGRTVNITLLGRTLYKDGKWNTLCLPFDHTIDYSSPLYDGVYNKPDVRELRSSSFENGVLTINFSEETVTQLKAGTPYLIKWTSDTNLSNVRFDNVTINQTPGKTETDYIDFIGCYDSGNIYQSGDKTNLYLGTNNTLYYPNSSSFNLNAFRGYFQLKNGLTAGEPADPVRSFVLNFGDETDGISDAVANSSSFTLHSSFQGWYTLDGRQLSGKPTQKGLYVNNGKKVIIK